jgi:probable HAF family extracellular repeat protein
MLLRARAGSLLWIGTFAAVASTVVHVPDAMAQAAPGRFSATELVRLFNAGASSAIRRINNQNEVAAGFVGADRGKSSQAFLLTSGGPLDLTADVPTDNAVALGVNDSGEVAGAYNTATALRPFRSLRRTGFRELPLLPGHTAGAAYSMNVLGDAVGYSSGPDGARAVVWSRAGAIQALPGSAGTTSRAFDVNPRGDVVGISGHQPLATIWPARGAPVTLGTLPGYSASEAVSIAENGNIVGTASGAPGQTRAVLWRSGSTTPVDLGTLPGGSYSRGRDGNASGQAVGMSHSANGERAVLWTETGDMVDLNTLLAVPVPGVTLTDAVSINRSGVILAISEGGHAHAPGELEVPRRIVVLTPSR